MAVLAERQTNRAREVESALASVRLEGLEPSFAAKALFEKYAEGQLTSDELDHELSRHLDATYGPVRLPGNDGT